MRRPLIVPRGTLFNALGTAANAVLFKNLCGGFVSHAVSRLAGLGKSQIFNTDNLSGQFH